MQMKKLFLILCLSAAPLAAFAAVSSKGTATVTYSGLLSAKVKQEALQKAKINALDRYYSEVEPAKARNYELVRDQLVASIDDYVLSAIEIAPPVEKNKTYTVTIRADLNGPKLENALRNSSSVANATTAEKSLMTFVFVARQQRSATSFEDRVTVRKDTSDRESTTYDEKRKTAETERVRRTGVSTSDSIEESTDSTRDTSSVTTTGGKTVRQADEIEWTVTRAAEINSVMTGTFANAGFEVVDAEYVEGESNGLLSVDAIRQDYSHGDDLAPLTQRNMVNGVKAAGIPYIAIGTLDVGMRDTDPATGNKRVTVTVSGQVLDLTGRFPRKVSAVGPVQFSALGQDESIARVNALKKAAENAAQQLMNELNAKGVK